MRVLPLALAISAALLTGCGGSSDSAAPITPVTPEPTPAPVPVPNEAPSITLDATASGDEKAELTLSAIASDSDGTIASYAWTIVSGPSTTLVNADTSAVTLTLPEVMSDTALELSLTVTDDDGATASSATTVNINQIKYDLKLMGSVIDAPIANAVVQVNVNGIDAPIETSANADGLYEVDLSIDDSLVGAFITIEAFGTGDQAAAGLVSPLGTLQNLLTMAGDDATLSDDEYFATRVTNFTTAQYAMALENGEFTITSDQALNDAFASQDFEEVMALAATLKVAIDLAGNDTGLQLPDGVENTLDLVQNSANLQSYISQVTDTEAYSEALTAVLGDSQIIADTGEWVVPEAYYFVPKDFNTSGAVFRYIKDNEDGTAGTGTSSSGNFAWSIENDVLSHVYEQAQDPRTLAAVFIDGAYQTVAQSITDSSETYKRVQSEDGVDMLVRETSMSLTYPDGEFPDETILRRELFTAVSNTKVIENDLAAGDTLFLGTTLNVVDSSFLFADKYTLSDTGATAAYSQKTFNYSVDDGALTLTPTDEVSRLVATPLDIDSDSGVQYFLFDEYFDAQNTFPSKSAVVRGLITPSESSWDAQSVPGIYSLADGVNGDTRYQTWIELNQNNDVIFYYNSNRNAQGGPASYEFSRNFGKWAVSGDGDLVITRGFALDFAGNTVVRQACSDGEKSDCVVGSSNTYDLMSIVDDKITVLALQTFSNDFTSFSTETITLTKVDESPLPTNALEDEPVPFTTQELVGHTLSLFNQANQHALTLNFTADQVTDRFGNQGTYSINFDVIEITWAGENSTGGNIGLLRSTIDPVSGAHLVRRRSANGEVDDLRGSLLPSEDMQFSSSEIVGTPYYVGYLVANECDRDYEIEPLEFASTDYELYVCGTNFESRNYQILDSGIIRIDFDNGEYIKKIAYDEDIDTYLICWDQDPEANCADGDFGYLFTDIDLAIVYVNRANGQ